jgi:predicted RND superfamily exporter protein
MDHIAARLDRFATAWAEQLLANRWKTIVLMIALVVAAAAGARLLTFYNHYSVWFSPDNPQLIAWEELQNTYTKNENVLLVVTPRDPAATPDAFSRAALAATLDLTREAWKLPYSLRVDSLTNFQHTRALATPEGDELVVEDLVPDLAALDDAALAERKRIALAEPLLAGRMVSRDGRYGAVNVTFQLNHESATEVPDLVAATRALVAEVEAAHPTVAVRLTGTAMMNNAFTESSQHDSATLIPAMFGAIAVVLWVMLRSLRATALTLVVVLMSIATAMGIVGWMGMRLTPPSATAPVVIMTLAVADGIHFLISYFAARRRGVGDHDAWVESLRNNLFPVFLTNVTTAVGFLTMNSSDVPPFQDMGNVTAIGVLAAFVLSSTLLPAAISLLGIRVPTQHSDVELRLERFADRVLAKRKPLLVAWAVAAVALLAAIPQNELNDDFIEYFDESIGFRRDTDFALENLTGMMPVQFSLPAPGSNGVSDPRYLAQVDRFSEWLRAQPEVVHVAPITEIFKRLNRNMHGDDPAWHKLPDDRELAAQYLLLYEMSLPFGLDLNNQINVDKSASQVIVTLGDITTVELRDFTARAEDWLRREAPEMATLGASPAVMFAHISKTNNESMISGTFWGLVIISGILVFALRSLKIGLISLIPNLLPIGMVFGIWGLLVGQINMAVSVIAATSMGIVVDDTIHFLNKYLKARREQGLGPDDAVRYAFTGVGVALFVMTAVLVVGFGILGLSSFQVNSYMGILTAAGIAVAMLAELTMLPPLLATLDHEPTEHALTDRGEIQEKIHAPH